jgi:hypothetical protein
MSEPRVKRAIVTLENSLDEAGETRDLDVPTDLPTERLIELLLQAFAPSRRPPGGVIFTRFVLRFKRDDGSPLELEPKQSLADVGAWDGSILELAGIRDKIEGRRGGPVDDWNPILINSDQSDDGSAIVSSDDQPTSASNPSYVPKRID